MSKSMNCLFAVGALTMMLLLYMGTVVYANEEPEENELYAKAAVLMDADSGRVLYEKNGGEQLPMASTTKIMTCILVLEKGNLDELVTVSSYAASQPKVRLGMKEGEQYLLRDLLYSLMLESHNDSAVAVAEHIGGSVEGFAAMMNQKAMELGCKDTYFVTPNGLDAAVTIAKKDGKAKVEEHRTTAADLARIMAYCIRGSVQSDQFLEITRKSNYEFYNQVEQEDRSGYINGTHHVSCTNHNAFLSMMDGALSGKTGFTNKAGYCYVAALEDEEKTFTVALLACGWPNHKTYKWIDTKALMTYGKENYEYHSFHEKPLEERAIQPIKVSNGQTDRIGEQAYTNIQVSVADAENAADGLLMKKEEEIGIIYTIPKELNAPVVSGSQIGSIKYLVDGRVWRTELITTVDTVNEIDYPWCLAKIIAIFLT